MSPMKSTRALFGTSGHKRHAKEHLISNFTSGPIDFWKTSRWCVDFDHRFGTNELSNLGDDVFAVTLNGKGSFLKPDAAGKDSFPTKLWRDVRVNWFAFDREIKGVCTLASIITALTACILFLLLSLVTNIGISAFIGWGFSTAVAAFFITMMIYGRVRTRGMTSLRGHRRWGFPVDEEFIVLDQDTASSTVGLLKKLKDHPNMCERVRTKLMLDLDHDNIKEWMITVNKIMDIDNEFPHDGIPFLNEHTRQVLTALQMKAGLIPAPALDAPSPFDISALTARVSSPLALLPTAELRSEMQSARINSESDLFYAISYIENM